MDGGNLDGGNFGKWKCGLFDSMYQCSPKMINIGFRSIKSRGPVLVYSNYVLMEGLEVFKIYSQSECNVFLKKIKLRICIDIITYLNILLKNYK